MKTKDTVYRIKDLNTNKYYRKRDWETARFPNIHKDETYSYKYERKDFYREITYYLYLDEIGHFYPTQKGAEKMISELTSCSKSVRATKAGRLLNARFNFVVVKSKLKVEDIVEKDETENVSISPENKPEISK